jgi:hypothetical protein
MTGMGDTTFYRAWDPDGDGDDDSTPEGDTDHDYFDEDGNQIKPIPPCPGPASSGKKQKKAKADSKVKNADVDNSEWDASKAWHNGSESDDPAAFFKAICAGEHTTGDPATQSHWALPYKYTPSSPPNAAGVRNALSRLPKTEGLANAEAARTKLEGLMKQINPDYESSNAIDTRLLSMVLGDALRGEM